MMRRLLGIVLLAAGVTAHASYDATSKRATDLSGHWVVNAALSDDPERMLQERLDKERRQIERWRRVEESTRPSGTPPPIDIDSRGASEDAGRRDAYKPRPWQIRQQENYRKMLGISPTLHIEQQGTQLQIVSAVDSRRVQAGTRSQVSMPEGELADSQVGWDGEWFVIERRVRQGPRVTEKLRLLAKTGQLEYLMSWSGDSDLAGIKVRRIYDRGAPPAGSGAPVDAQPEIKPLRTP